MLGCFIELALLAYGAFLLVVGEFRFPGFKPIRGAMVRVAGVVLAAPIPVCFIAGFITGFAYGIQGISVTPAEFSRVLILVELGVIIACVLGAAALVAMAGATQPVERDPRAEARQLLREEAQYERALTFDAPDRALDVLPLLPAPDAPQGITGQRPPLPVPPGRMAASDSYLTLPHRHELLPSPSPLPESGRSTLLMIIACALVFLFVTGVGSALMR